MLSEREAQELHELVGVALESVRNGETAVVAELERARELASIVITDASEPTNVQALALARLMRDFSDTESVSLSTHAFDLPEGYWSVALTSAYDTSTGNRRTFACGIAPDGSVSS